MNERPHLRAFVFLGIGYSVSAAASDRFFSVLVFSRASKGFFARMCAYFARRLWPTPPERAVHSGGLASMKKPARERTVPLCNTVGR